MPIVSAHFRSLLQFFIGHSLTGLVARTVRSAHCLCVLVCSFFRLLFTKIGSTNMQYYCVKIKQKGKQVIRAILLDNETAYHTDYTAIRQVSLSKFVFTRGHSV